jgi:hypothetical protein
VVADPAQVGFFTEFPAGAEWSRLGKRAASNADTNAQRSQATVNDRHERQVLLTPPGRGRPWTCCDEEWR